MAIELTREELFNQVWERPMTKVAADYNISDVALKKICNKHRIPVPGRGYWAKKAAGKSVERAYFRAVTDPAVDRVLIHGSAAQNLPEAVKAVKAAAKAREQRPENKIEVIAVPENLHPKVERTGNQLKKAKPSVMGLVVTSSPNLFHLEIGPASVERAIAFLHALVVAAEARGHCLVEGDRALAFGVDGETIDFKIVEQTRCFKHEPTEAERAAIEKWEKRQQRRHRSWDTVDWTPRPTLPEWDYEPNGQLRVIINEGHHGYDGLRRTFGDGRIQRIETLTNAILEAFVTWSAAIKAKREEDERRRRAWEEEERQRQERQRRNALEKKRVAALLDDLEQWHRHRQVLDYVAAVEAKLNAGSYEEAEAALEWISWAKDYADRINPLTEGLPRLQKFEDFKPWELNV